MQGKIFKHCAVLTFPISVNILCIAQNRLLQKNMQFSSRILASMLKYTFLPEFHHMCVLLYALKLLIFARMLKTLSYLISYTLVCFTVLTATDGHGRPPAIFIPQKSCGVSAVELITRLTLWS